MTLAPPTTEAQLDAFRPFIRAVGRGEKLKRDLTYDEARDALRMILRREASDVQIGAFLIPQRVKGESVDEIRGFTDVVREEFMQSIHPKVDGLLDLAPPYDGKAKTAQLAPAVALVLVSAGIPVIIHGDENVPTKGGVTPGAVLAGLGIAPDRQPDDVERMIEAVGFGHLRADRYVPLWSAFSELRWHFGLRTVFNTVEKLFNPAHAPYQISGFFHANYIERIRETQTGTQKSWMVQGEEGSIEMAAGRRSQLFAPDSAEDLILEPSSLGLSERVRVSAEPDVAQHVALNASVMAGETSAAAEQVALTAGTMLYLLGAASAVGDGFEQVRKRLADGRVAETLDRVRSWQ